MVLGSWPFADAGVRAGACVQPERESLGVSIVHNRLHSAREVAAVRLKEAGGVAFVVGPAVVQVEVPVARIIQPDLAADESVD